jgi:flagellar L-ring protein precursor FlgH
MLNDEFPRKAAEYGGRRIDVAAPIKKNYLTSVFLSPALCLLVLLSSCASTPKLPPKAQRYVYPQTPTADASMPAANSLWKETASLYEDNKARRLNDLITISVVEDISGSGTANTAASRKSSAATGIDSLLGIPTNLNLPNLFGNGNTISPTISASMQDDFTGSGSTDRAGKIIGTITAKVVEVMPNGTLSVESRKEITINNEKQILIVRGMVRPDDVAVDNTVLSNRVADAEVFLVGDGVIQGKQNTGWLVKILDKIWPF